MRTPANAGRSTAAPGRRGYDRVDARPRRRHRVARRRPPARGDLPYVLRRSPRATRLRVTVHPERGVVVTVPPTSRRGWGAPSRWCAASSPSASPGSAATWRARRRPGPASTRAPPSTTAGRSRTGACRTASGSSRPPRACARAAWPGSAATMATSCWSSAFRATSGPPRRSSRPGFAAVPARTSSARSPATRPALGVHPASVTIRDTTTRWGSCSRRGALSFSWRLVLAPPEALDAVAAHELCHLRVFGHGPFWSLLAGRVPDHAAWRRWLRRHAPELHAALDSRATGDDARAGQPAGGTQPTPPGTYDLSPVRSAVNSER